MNNLISIELKDNHTLVKVLVDLDFSTANEIREIFIALIEHADRNVRLDLSLSQHLDSSGIGAIAFLYKRLKRLDFELEIINLNEHPLCLIKTLQMDDVIPIVLTSYRNEVMKR